MRNFFFPVLILLFLLPQTAFAGEATAETSPKVDIPNAVVHGPFLVGGQPTLEQLAEVANAGYKTVVFTRGEGEIDWDEKAEVEKLGMRWIELPIASRDELTEENARRFAEIVHDESLHPMMVHCGSGNRVGALFALASFHVAGKSAEEALEIGKNMGVTRMEKVVRQKLGLPVED